MSRNSLRRLLTLTLVLPVIVQWHILDRSFFQVPDPLPDVEFITPENADRLVTLYIIQTGPDSLVKVQFSPDHEVLATWSYESNDVQLWELETGSLIAKLEGHLGDVHHFAFSPDSTLLASSAGDRTVRVWDTKTGNFLYQFQYLCQLCGESVIVTRANAAETG